MVFGQESGARSVIGIRVVGCREQHGSVHDQHLAAAKALSEHVVGFAGRSARDRGAQTQEAELPSMTALVTCRVHGSCAWSRKAHRKFREQSLEAHPAAACLSAQSCRRVVW